MTEAFRPAVLIAEAVQCSHDRFYASAFSGSDLTIAEQKKAMRYLEDPFWRPLCELELNGATSFEGALLLLATKFIDCSTFRVRHGPAIGSYIQSIDFTDSGLAQFQYYADEQTDAVLKEKVLNSLMSYSVIDKGSGVVARRCAIEAAVENHDWDFLNRLRSIPNGIPQFQITNAEENLTEEERSEYLKFVSGWEGQRSGARIVDLKRFDKPIL